MDEISPASVHVVRKASLEKISFIILGVVALILPFFIIPSQYFGIGLSKGLLVSVGVLASFAMYLISLIRDGRFEFPKNLAILSVLLVPLVFFVSAIANGFSQQSVIGLFFENGTVTSVFLGFLFLFLVSQLFRSKERIFYSYLGFFASFGIIALYHIVRILLGADILSFGYLVNQTSNLIGSWNDLALFFGATAVLSIVTLEMVALNKLFKVLIYVAFALSLVFLVIVNFSTVWYVLAVFSLIVFLYVISFSQFSQSQELAHDMKVDNTEGEAKNYQRKISYNALILLVLSVVFIFAGSGIGERIANSLNVASIEVRPAWSATFEIAGKTLKESPVFGTGPNSFVHQWLRHKPEGINDTFFWATDFSFGIGLIPTYLTTTGLIGLLAWLFFFVMFLYVGIKAIFQSVPDLFSRYLVTSSFLVALFFWVMNVFYVPSVVNVFLGFFFTGLFFAAAYKDGLLKSVKVSLTNNPKVNFLSVLILVVLLIGSVTYGYLLIQKLSSTVYFQKSVAALNRDQDLDQAQNYMVRAVELGDRDLYYRGLSEISLIKVSEILNREGATIEGIRDEFQQTLANSIENARRATEVNPKGYQNWATLGRIYGELVPQPFAVPGAYESSKTAYEEALKVNPHSPAIYLLLARLEVANNNLDGARDYANMAIREKSNYADAHFLISQIEVTQGNLSQAIPALETTLLLSPNNPGLFFQLGILKYNDRDFEGAIPALTNAVVLIPDYANAKYFLGLSLYNVGEVEAAILQFEGIEKTNPDNQEVKLILSNLREGLEPFANVAPPLDDRPERREELPLEEEN
jgi:tetratricopeptide (TPR) repeat protein